MARRLREPKLETRAARLRLPIAKKAQFIKIGRGLWLGYRRNQTAGTWSVRLVQHGTDWSKTFATADDFEEANGSRILDFWRAQDQARALAQGRQKEDDPADDEDAEEPIAVRQALDNYERDLEIRGGDVGNASRVRAHLPDALAKKEVARLTVRDLRGWRDRLTGQLAPATVNRTANALRAALNLAADHVVRITDRRAWEIGLTAIRDAEQPRNVILPEPEIRAIIAKAYEHRAEFGLLVEVAAVTGGRMSQIAGLEVQDLQDNRPDPRLVMPSSHKVAGERPSCAAQYQSQPGFPQSCAPWLSAGCRAHRCLSNQAAIGGGSQITLGHSRGQ